MNQRIMKKKSSFGHVHGWFKGFQNNENSFRFQAQANVNKIFELKVFNVRVGKFESAMHSIYLSLSPSHSSLYLFYSQCMHNIQWKFVK